MKEANTTATAKGRLWADVFFYVVGAAASWLAHACSGW